MSRSDALAIPTCQSREAGQEVRNAGSISQDLEQFLRKVYRVCKTINERSELVT